MHRKATLDFKGRKTVIARATNISALTHSYTIMPIINMDGKLAGKLFLVFREVGGAIPPTVLSRVSELVDTLGNIYVTASKSGKMGLLELRQWYQYCFWPVAGENSLLLLDSWSVYKNQTVLDHTIPSDKCMTLKFIPPGSIVHSLNSFSVDALYYLPLC